MKDKGEKGSFTVEAILSLSIFMFAFVTIVSLATVAKIESTTQYAIDQAAKEISKDEMRAIMRAYPEYAEGGEERPTPVWHGICAAILARTEWGVEDEAVLSAIACHTAGKPGMSRLDKILYLADMTSAERDWSGVNKLRRLERNDLDAAMLVALKQTNDFVLSQGKPLDPMSKAAYEDIHAQVEARAGTACGSSD